MCDLQTEFGCAIERLGEVLPNYPDVYVARSYVSLCVEWGLVTRRCGDGTVAHASLNRTEHVEVTDEEVCVEDADREILVAAGISDMGGAQWALWENASAGDIVRLYRMGLTNLNSLSWALWEGAELSDVEAFHMAGIVDLPGAAVAFGRGVSLATLKSWTDMGMTDLMDAAKAICYGASEAQVERWWLASITSLSGAASVAQAGARDDHIFLWNIIGSSSLGEISYMLRSGSSPADVTKGLVEKISDADLLVKVWRADSEFTRVASPASLEAAELILSEASGSVEDPALVQYATEVKEEYERSRVASGKRRGWNRRV